MIKFINSPIPLNHLNDTFRIQKGFQNDQQGLKRGVAKIYEGLQMTFAR